MSDEVQVFLQSYSREVRDLAIQTRVLVRKTLPNALEQLDTAAKLIGYGFGARYSDLVCVIMPLKSAVNLGFARGAELPDPAGLLAGTGKRARHVKLRTPSDLENPALVELLKAAAAVVKQ